MIRDISNVQKPILSDDEEGALERSIVRLEAIYEDHTTEGPEAILLGEELELLREIRKHLGRPPSSGEDGSSVN